MANLNLSQDVANKRKKLDIVFISYSLEQAVRIHSYGSLININPSEWNIVWGPMIFDPLMYMIEFVG